MKILWGRKVSESVTMQWKINWSIGRKKVFKETRIRQLALKEQQHDQLKGWDLENESRDLKLRLLGGNPFPSSSRTKCLKKKLRIDFGPNGFFVFHNSHPQMRQGCSSSVQALIVWKLLLKKHSHSSDRLLWKRNLYEPFAHFISI